MSHPLALLLLIPRPLEKYSLGDCCLIELTRNRLEQLSKEEIRHYPKKTHIADIVSQEVGTESVGKSCLCILCQHSQSHEHYCPRQVVVGY